MTKRQPDEAQGQRTPTAPEAAAPGPGREESPTRQKPVHEVRLGRVKAVIWKNDTGQGPRHNVTLRRIFKRDDGAQWEQSDSFGRDDLPLVMEVTRQAWLWVFEHGGQQG